MFAGLLRALSGLLYIASGNLRRRLCGVTGVSAMEVRWRALQGLGQERLQRDGARIALRADQSHLSVRPPPPPCTFSGTLASCTVGAVGAQESQRGERGERRGLSACVCVRVLAYNCV